MSIAKYSKKDFIAIKKLPNFFRFTVEDWREMETQFGKGIYFVGYVIKKPTELKKDGPTKGLLRISPTTATEFEKLGFREWDQLLLKNIDFEWSDDAKTILPIDVRNWEGASLVDRSEDDKKPVAE